MVAKNYINSQFSQNRDFLDFDNLINALGMPIPIQQRYDVNPHANIGTKPCCPTTIQKYAMRTKVNGAGTSAVTKAINPQEIAILSLTPVQIAIT